MLSASIVVVADQWSITPNQVNNMIQSKQIKKVNNVTMNTEWQPLKLEFKANLHVIPSALISCILQQDDTILIASLSTINTLHSTPPAALAAAPAVFFGFAGGLYLTTSFMISRIQHSYQLICILKELIVRRD